MQSCKDKKIEINLKQQVIDNYAALVYASYDDAVKKALDLKIALTALTKTPTQATFDAAKQAYIASREPYEQTEAYRFYDGPIDNAGGKEGEMNSWPMDEAYVDYVQGNAKTGIINDTTIAINGAKLATLNTLGGETNISTGYHAIEFLLWGQDFYANSPGQRPYTDYVVGGTAANQTRRAQYLLAVADLLIADLTYTRDAWAEGSSYRKTFTEQNPDKSLQLILTGLGKFCDGELYGQRMLTAYDTQNQEDEHSCFSDQTQHDLVLGQKSIDNVYYGRYKRLDGTVIEGKSINDLLVAQHTTLSMDIQTQFSKAKDAVATIRQRFDQEIINPAGRVRVRSAIDNGKALALQIVAGAKALGITIVL